MLTSIDLPGYVINKNMPDQFRKGDKEQNDYRAIRRGQSKKEPPVVSQTGPKPQAGLGYKSIKTIPQTGFTDDDPAHFLKAQMR